MKKLTLLLLLTIVPLLSYNIAHAQDRLSAWIDNSNVSVDSAYSYEGSSPPLRFGSTIPCNAYRHNFSLSNSKDYCVIDVGGLMLTNNNEILLKTSDKVYSVVNKYSTEDRIIPLQNRDRVIALKGNGANTKVVLINNPYNNLKLEKYGLVFKYSIVGTSQETLTDTLNNIPLTTDYYQTVSANGDWFVGQSGNGIYKLNLRTKELQFIRAGMYGQAALNPLLKLAIDNEGRHVAVYSGKSNTFEVIDTHQCNNIMANKGVNAECKTNSYMVDIKNNIPSIRSFDAIRTLQFETSNNISFYAYTNWIDATNFDVEEINIKANKTNTTTLDYLAVGDSFASGEGAYNYKEGTDIIDNKCHLSIYSYPYQLYNRKLFNSTESVACSGAKTKDVINYNNIEYKLDYPQYTKYTHDDFKDYVTNNYVVGNRRQIDFVIKYRPSNVTVSVGGNDIGFSSIIKSCVTATTECYKTKQERQRLISMIDNTYPNLVKTYETLKKESANNSKIYVIGYPLVAKTDGNCAANVKLSNTEIDFSIRLTKYLNSVVKMAATQAGVVYVDTEHAFDGRRLCEADSSLVAVNGFTAGNDGPFPGWVERLVGNGPIGKESYHPNFIGHSMYARTIAMETNNFTLAMPTPSPGNPSQLTAEKRYVLENVPEGVDYGAESFYFDDMVKDGVVRGDNLDINIPYNQYLLKPSSTYSGTMYSTPTDLGTVTTDANGNINATVTIPQSIEPGYHTLHISGPNILGETIDIQKIIFVAASEQDIDGDGIANEDEVCLIGEPAGVDVDKDGIDDACDGFIDEAPALPVTPEPTPDPTPEPVPTPTPEDKELIVSESMPEWLLQIEKEIAARQAIVNAPTPTQTTIVTTPSQRQVPTLSQSVTTTTAEQPQTTPQPPATQVAGVSSAVETLPISQTSQFNVWLLLPAGIFILFISLLWRTYVKARV